MLSKILVLALFGCSLVLGSPIPNQENDNGSNSIDYSMSLKVKFQPSSGLDDLQDNVLNDTIANLYRNIDFLHKRLMAKGAKKHVGTETIKSVAENVGEMIIKELIGEVKQSVEDKIPEAVKEISAVTNELTEAAECVDEVQHDVGEKVSEVTEKVSDVLEQAADFVSKVDQSVEEEVLEENHTEETVDEAESNDDQEEPVDEVQTEAQDDESFQPSSEKQESNDDEEETVHEVQYEDDHEAEDDASRSSVESSQTEEPAKDNAESQKKKCDTFDFFCHVGFNK